MKEVTAAKLNCLSSLALSVRPFSVLSLRQRAQERKLDYGNEAEKKFAGERRTEEEEERGRAAKREGGSQEEDYGAWTVHCTAA